MTRAESAIRSRPSTRCRRDEFPSGGQRASCRPSALCEALDEQRTTPSTKHTTPDIPHVARLADPRHSAGCPRPVSTLFLAGGMRSSWTTVGAPGGYWLGADDLAGPWTITAALNLGGQTNLLRNLDGSHRISVGPQGVTIQDAIGSHDFLHSALPNGQWVDLALVSDGSAVTLYRNGQQVSTVTSSIGVPRARMLSGAAASAPLARLAGLDIYAEELDAEQVAAARIDRPAAQCANYPAPATLPSPDR